MTDSLKTFIQYISGHVKHYSELDPIVELGSLPAQNQIELANLRGFFKDKEYIGIDQYPGLNVDKIANIENLDDIKDESIGLVLCLETLEHCQHPIRAVSEIFRILKPKGIAIISTPMFAPVHMDEDYWRLTPEGMREIVLYGYEEKYVYYQGERHFPFNIIGVGSKKEMPFIIDINYLNGMLPWPYPFIYNKL
jgi:SAM-dependent methyltransferase